MGSLITNFIVPGPQKRPKIACTEARGGEIARGVRVIRGRPIIESHRVLLPIDSTWKTSAAFNPV